MNARLPAAVLLSAIAASSPAYGQMPIGYGASVTLEQARTAAAAAVAEARKNQWTVVVSIVDTGGNLVYLERLDGTQVGSVEVAIGKARTANGFKRPTKVFEDSVLGGRTVVLGVPNVVPVEGGLPLVVGDKIVGAIGVSGATSQQDGVVAAAGVAALK